MTLDEEKALLYKILAELLAKKSKKLSKKQKTKTDVGVLNKALQAVRLLPGAKLVRNGRPLTDYTSKIKKMQRRVMNSEYFKYRGKVVKGPQKALVNSVRSQAKKAYKKK